MSTEALIAAVIPPGEAATLERIRQLQALLLQTRAVAAGQTASAVGAVEATGAAGDEPAPGAAGSFAAALAAASSTAPAAAGSTAPAAASSTAPTAAGSDGPEAAQPAAYEAEIEAAAARHGIDPALLFGLIQQESGFDPSARSGAGALGLTQLMPSTAASLGVADPLDPAESIEGGAAYLASMMQRFGGNAEEALAAYNAGPGAVEQYNGVPPYPETEQYVARVLQNAQTYRLSHPSSALGGVAA